MLALDAQRYSFEQGAPSVVEPFALDTMPSRRLALQTAAHHGEPCGAQMHDVERVDDLDRVGVCVQLEIAVLVM